MAIAMPQLSGIRHLAMWKWQEGVTVKLASAKSPEFSRIRSNLKMTIEAVTKTIGLILAPVVMISACALILNGLLARYASIGDRLRLVNQERLNLLELDLSQNRFKADRLHELDRILPDWLRHHHLVHDVLVLVDLAILVFMLDMLVIALAISTLISWLSQLVVIVFLIGIGILFWGMVLIAHELRTSHRSIQFEVHRTCHLCSKSSSNSVNR